MAKDLPIRRVYTDTRPTSKVANDWINTAESLLRNAGYNTAGKFSSIRTVTKNVTEVTDMLPAQPRNEKSSTSSTRRLESNYPNYDSDYRNSKTKVTQDLNQETGGKTGVIRATSEGQANLRGRPDRDNIETSTRDTETTGTARSASESLASNLSIIPRSLDDLNTKFTNPLVTALDPNRNSFQKLVNNTMAKVDPRLGAAAAVGYAAAINEGGLKSLTKRSGAVGTLTGILTGKLDPVQATQKIRQITSPERRNIATSVTNVTKPLSDFSRDLSRAVANPIDAIGKATGTDTRAIKLGAGIAKQLGVFNSSSDLQEAQTQRTYNKVLNTAPAFDSVPIANDPRIQNVIGAKNAALVSAGSAPNEDPVQNISVLGKSLADNYAFDTAKVAKANNVEIKSLVGGEFDQVRRKIIEQQAQTDAELEQFTKGTNAESEAALSSAGQPKKQGRDGSIKFGNQLRKYNSYNYILTLGVLNSEEYNFPSNLEKRGFSQIIVKSGGGSLDRRITTIEEDALGGHAEYFIDELEIDVVIAPSQNTGVGVGTNVSFNIIEPYSMGKFLETLKLASENVGYKNFSKVPFCLRIDFVGYDSQGNVIEDSNNIKPRFFPIMINNIEFNVSGSGSTYALSCVAYSDVPHSDMVNSIKTDITGVGVRAHQVLESSEDSITKNINEHVELLEEQKRIAGYDRTIIVFPKDKTSLKKALEGQGISQQELKVVDDAEQERIRLGTAAALATTDRRTIQVNKNTINSAPPKIYKFLKAWTSNDNNINEIGLSPLAEDTNEGKSAKNAKASDRRNTETQIDDGSSTAANVPQKSKAFKYTQGTKITEIIEDVVLTSKYGLDAPSQESKDGKKKWFKIETMVFIEQDEKVEESIGRPRMTYVYSVIPYYVDEAKFLAPKEAPKNTDKLKATALKEYEYIYTGKNEDILDFDINFNNAFFQLVMADVNQGNTAAGNSTKGTDPKEQTKTSETVSETNNEQAGSVNLTPRLDRIIPKGSTSSPENEVKRRIAEQFHDRLINSEVDMITANMQIWGDPFYIPLDTGNNRVERAGANATQGGSMDYTYHEVCCNINFLTPLDYPNKPGNFVMDFPELVRPFSGFFQVLAVTNSFSNGKFTQDLKLVRRPRQTDKETGTKGVTETGNTEKSLADREARENQALGRGARPPVGTDPAPTTWFNDQTDIGGA